MDPLYGPRSEFIEQLAPGEIDWELVDESDSNLTISCDPEGNVEEESVVCDLMRDLGPTDRHVAGLEYWQASRRLRNELLIMLPALPLSVAG